MFQLNVCAKRLIERSTCFSLSARPIGHGLFDADDLMAVRAFAETMTGTIHFAPWPQPTGVDQFGFFHTLSLPQPRPDLLPLGFWRFVPILGLGGILSPVELPNMNVKHLAQDLLFCKVLPVRLKRMLGQREHCAFRKWSSGLDSMRSSGFSTQRSCHKTNEAACAPGATSPAQRPVKT